MRMFFTDGRDGRKIVEYSNPTPDQAEWAWRRVQDIRVAMSGCHESGFIHIVDDILAKGRDK